MKGIYRTATIAMLVAFLFLCIPACMGAKFETDSRIQPTHKGPVEGSVYDAVTGQPIKDAVVTFMSEGQFPSRGDQVDKTNQLGQYKCQVLIGRKAKSFNVLKALVGRVGDIGNAVEKSERIDVDRLVCRVTKDGYKTFEGVLPSSSQFYGSFAVGMQPIMLYPADSKFSSFVATGWTGARLVSVDVTPWPMQTGVEATIKARVKSVPELKNTKTTVSLESEMIGRTSNFFGIRDTEPTPMKFEGTEPGGISVYSFTSKPRKSPQAEHATVTITGCPFGVEYGKDRLNVDLQLAGGDSAAQGSAEVKNDGHTMMVLPDLDTQSTAVQKSFDYSLPDYATTPDSSLDSTISSMQSAPPTDAKKIEPVVEFQRYHDLAMLLYRKSVLGRRSGSSPDEGVLASCRDNLVKALLYSRAPSSSTDSTFDYQGTTFYGAVLKSVGDYNNQLAPSDFDLLNAIDAESNGKDSPAMKLYRATALLDLGLLDAAQKEFDAVSKTDPNNADVKYGQAMIQYRKGETAKAGKLLDETLKCNPHHPYANLLIAKILLADGDKTRAERYLKAHSDFYGFSFFNTAK